jgi:hypothetical protein
MTNEEYQRQAAERSRQVDEARRRQSLEDFNRHERDRAARNAQAQKENYSRSLGSRGITPPLLGPGVDRAAYNRARQAYDANQRSLQQFKQGFSSGGSGSYSGSYGGSSSYSGSSGGSGKAKSAGAGLVVLLIVIAVIAYSGSGGRSTNSQNTDNTSSSAAPQSDSGAAQSSPEIPKPSPDNQDQNRDQYQNPQQPPPTQQSEPQSATTTAPGSNGTVPESAPTGANAPGAPPPPVSMTRTANRDGINNGCKGGQLIVDPSTITFTCPSDPSKNVDVSSGQVIEVDKNGIVVYPKLKYHFDIDGMNKQEVHDLFAQWLESARKASAPSVN